MKVLSLLCLTTISAGVLSDPHVNGTWGPVQDWPLIAIHSVLLKNGKLLTYGNINNGKLVVPDLDFYYDVWDPATNTHHTLSYNGGEKGTNIFCSGQVQLSSTGEILITGGSQVINGTKNYGIAHAQFFNPDDDSLELAENNMHVARWYPSVTSLGNSKIIVQGGTGNTAPKRGITTPEVYNPNTGKWTLLTGANSTLYRQKSAWWYPRSYAARKNTVITFPSFQNDIWRLDPRGDGSLKSVATVPGPAFKKEAPATMFDRHKILAIQGVQEAVVVDISNPNAPTFEKTGQLREKRFWANSVSLPNGEVLVVGGSSVSQQLDTAVKYAEIWNPTTGQWRVAAEAAKARLYHSTAILLPDATVLVGGGGRPGPVVNENVEIYSPPYLFQPNGDGAIRPVITSLSTKQPAYGGTIRVDFSDAANIGRVSLIRLGSVTHSFNMDERMLSLAFSQHSNVVATTSTPQVRRLGAPTTSLTPEDTTTFAPERTTTTESTATVTSAAETTQEATTTTSLPDTTPESTTEATQEATTTTSVAEPTTTSTPEVATTTTTTEATAFWLNVKLPGSKSVILPGWYMLFIVNDEGVPSVAEMVQFSGN